MKREVRKTLSELQEVDWIELHKAMILADSVKSSVKRYKQTKEWWANNLEVTMKEFEAILNGSYPFDLMIISKIEAVRNYCESQLALLTMEPIITFPDYRI